MELSKYLANNLANNLEATSQMLQAKMHQPVVRITPPEIPILSTAQKNPAQWTYERIVAYIRDFESTLDEEHEIGARLIAFGPSITIHIENLGYHGPDIISFDGLSDQGERVQLIQNISQLNILLIAMKKQNEKPRRIGFSLDSETDSKS